MTRPRLTSPGHPTDRLIGTSPALDALRVQIQHLATFDTLGSPLVPTVLLRGETGTGKGLVARVLHDSGPRARGPFIEVNCAAIPETLLESELFGFTAGAFTDAKRAKPGLLEAASGGTLFLDEVDALPLPLQGKLLKAIEEKRVRRLGAVVDQSIDLKLTAATQAELSARVAEGRFRADLYYRLAVILLEIPSLRERGTDVLDLAQQFLQQYAEGHRLPPKKLSEAAEAWLQSYPWPGNVRELSHLMERVTLLHSDVVLDPQSLERWCLPHVQPTPTIEAEPTANAREREDEPTRIRRILDQTEGNVVQAARLLGLSRKALRYRMNRYGIERPSRKEAFHSLAERTGELAPPHSPKSEPGWQDSTLWDDVEELPTREEPHALIPGWEQKLVAVLAIEVTWPEPMVLEALHYEPWTMTTHWEQAIAEKVQGFGGVVLQSTPSLRLVAFGLPRTLEQLPQRAVQAALALRHLFIEACTGGREVPCPAVRQALHWGQLLVDVHASNPAERLMAIGETLALPVRLLGQTAHGEILVSTQLGGLVEGWCVLQPCEITDPDRPDRIRALRLIEVNAGDSLLARHGTHSLSQFVGRRRELRTLRTLFAQAKEGRGQVGGLMGDAGVGKSRLLYEFCRDLPGQRVTFMEAHSLSYGNPSPYLPVRELIKAYCSIEEQDDSQKIRDKLILKLRRLDQSIELALPAFLDLLNVPVEDFVWQTLDASQRRQRMLNAIKHLLLRESQVHPLILIFHDLHWIDSATQELLDSLVESLPTAQLLLLVSYRPEYQHNWGSKSYYTQLRLDPLSPASAVELLQSLLGKDPSLEQLTRFLIKRSEGNPFFLEESVRTLVETQVLVGERGAYHVVQPFPALQIPVTVQALLAARIDHLSLEDKRLLQLASVIGKDVPFDLLQAIAELPEGELRGRLALLQASEFLYEKHVFPEPAYTFKHALTQEVAYGSLPERRRYAYHAAIGVRLEELYSGRIDEVVDLLAYHFGRSAQDEKAVDYAILAAEKAQQRWANTEALAYFDAALKRLEAMPDTASNQLRRVDAVLKQAESKFALGRHTEHIKALEGIRGLVDGLADPRRRAPWYYWTGFLLSLTGSRPEVAIAYCREASTMAEGAGLDELRAFAESCLAQVYLFVGDLRAALVAGESALMTFEAHGNVWWACRTLWHLITIANALGEWRQGLEYCRRALAHGQRVDDLRLKVVGWWRTGSTHIQQGDATTGLQCCEQALALSPIPYDIAMIRAVRGHGLVKVGEVEAGTTELAEAVVWFDRSHLRYTRSVFALRLGEAYLRQGKHVQARTIFEDVFATSHEAGYRHLIGVAERLLGESFTTENPALAAPHLEAASRILEEVGARNEVAKVLVAQANLCYAGGNPTGARQLFERALTLFETLGTLDEPHRVRAALLKL
jgi:DNA-binding NtrC family response regulator/tetratricopeptide (TPR) repeat protein